MLSPLFWEIHSGLAREGPGDEESLRRALALMTDLPPAPRILDIGCGPGAQTLALLAQTRGRVTAIDQHQPYLDQLKASAEAAGVSDRLTTLDVSMAALPFEAGGFDAIWSEGAIYFIGLRQGLTAWRKLLAPGGYVAVTEPCWLKPREALPEGALKAWADYPAMSTTGELVPIMGECGYRPLGHFVLPPEAWWNYYRPIEARLAALRVKYADYPGRLEQLAHHQAEIDAYRAFGDSYGYLFLVMQIAD
jgi:SAM-dependent methyltransferase